MCSPTHAATMALIRSRRADTACATCGAMISNPRPRQLYCSPVTGRPCGRFGAALLKIRALIDRVLGETSSATRVAAVFRLRRAIGAAVLGADIPDVNEKQDGGRRRRWCACCRTELGDVMGRGRPPKTCRAATGRDCERLLHRMRELRGLARRVLAEAGDVQAARTALAEAGHDIAREVGLV